MGALFTVGTTASCWVGAPDAGTGRYGAGSEGAGAGVAASGAAGANAGLAVSTRVPSGRYVSLRTTVGCSTSCRPAGADWRDTVGEPTSAFPDSSAFLCV